MHYELTWLGNIRRSQTQWWPYHPHPLRWRHNGHDGVSNHQPHHCSLNRLLGADQRKHQSSASLAFVRGIHRGPVNSPHKWPVKRKKFPFDDVIMSLVIDGITDAIMIPYIHYTVHRNMTRNKTWRHVLTHRGLFFSQKNLIVAFSHHMATKCLSTLAQVLAWCLTAPNHCVNQCRLLISEVLWRST